MFKARLRNVLLVTISLILGMCLTPWTAMAQEENKTVPQTATQAALSLVAQRSGMKEAELTVTGSSSVTLPLTGASFYTFKISHDLTGTAYEISLDDALIEYDLEAAFNEEMQAHAAVYGNIDPDFHAKLGNATPDTFFDTFLWVAEPFFATSVNRPDPDSEIAESEIDALTQQLDAERQAVVSTVVAPVRGMLEAMGYFVEEDPYLPVLYAQLPADMILNVVSKWAEIQSIDEAVPYQGSLEFQVPTIESNVVHNLGITGSGVRVGVIEVGGRINTANPYLAGVVQDLTYSCQHFHAAAVTGIVRSTDLTRRGNAYGSQVWVGGSCGGSSSQLSNRSTAAANWGARTFNLSFGANLGGNLGTLDRYYDGLVLNRWRTVVVAAGNNGATGRVLSPATAYNVIAVGSFDDKNNSTWADDTMSSFSSGVDPNSWIGDREKPEVAAPGSNINSTTLASPWTGAVGSGTSYAAPAVTGQTALLMQRWTTLQVWPEIVKAIVMATAEHNIEGATRLSELDGAGGVVVDRGDDIARLRHGGRGGRSYNCSQPTWTDLATFTATTGERVRVAMAWDNDPAYAQYTTRPGADLDLWVRSPTGLTAAVSASWDNTYEIVDFTASQTGTYTIRAYKWRCSSNPQWLGWAWHIVE